MVPDNSFDENLKCNEFEEIYDENEYGFPLY